MRLGLSSLHSLNLSPDYSSDWHCGGGSSSVRKYYGDVPGHSLPNVPMQLNKYGSCVSYAILFISNYLGFATNPFHTFLHIDKIAVLFPPSSAYERGLSLTETKWAIEGVFESNQINSVAQVNAAISSVIANPS